jgi:aldehyde dehydrogenase (NAD+)
VASLSAPIGDPTDPATVFGPLITPAAREKTESYIRSGLDQGARIVLGGGRPKGLDKGYFVEPTIFTDVTPEMRIAQEEVFGPVLALMVANDFDDAMRLANCVKFGLSASIVTRDLTRVHQFTNQIQAGLITVNLPTAGVEYQLPFGGTKESSFGMREQGPLALDFYTETRTVYLKYTQ